MSSAEVIFLTDHPHRTPPGDQGIVYETFRGSGPGGQKKNKTSSAVRAVHPGTGLSAVSSDSREQARNKELALARLRTLLTLRCRYRVFLDRLELPAGFDISAGTKSPAYLSTVGFVLDVLHAADWVMAPVAARLGVTTGALSRLLTSTPELLSEVNRQRGRLGLRPLR
jgi:hypothetical protein